MLFACVTFFFVFQSFCSSVPNPVNRGARKTQLDPIWSSLTPDEKADKLLEFALSAAEKETEPQEIIIHQSEAKEAMEIVAASLEIGKSGAELAVIAEEEKAKKAEEEREREREHGHGESTGAQHEPSGGEHGSQKGHGERPTGEGHNQTSGGQRGVSHDPPSHGGEGQPAHADQAPSNRGETRSVYAPKRPYSIILELHPVGKVSAPAGTPRAGTPRAVFNDVANLPNSQLYYVPPATG